jgi:hypothetical protein
LYWWWWSRSSCSSSMWCAPTCCGKLTRVWKWVILRTPVCLTIQLDSASARLGFQFAGIQTNGPKLALRDSDSVVGNQIKYTPCFWPVSYEPSPPAPAPTGSPKGLQATNRATTPKKSQLKRFIKWLNKNV